MYDVVVTESPSLAAGVKMGELMGEGGSGATGTLPAGQGAGQGVGMTPLELHQDLRACVSMMGVGGDTEEGGAASTAGTSADLGDVKRFLNRILGLPVRRQNLMFNYFYQVCTAGCVPQGAAVPCSTLEVRAVRKNNAWVLRPFTMCMHPDQQPCDPPASPARPHTGVAE